MSLVALSSSSSVRGLVARKSSSSRQALSFAAPLRSAARRAASVKAAASPLSSSSSSSTFSLSPRRPPMASFLRGLMGSKVRFLLFFDYEW